MDEGKTVKGFVEFDFPGVTSRKCLYIQRTKQLLQAVSDEGKVLLVTVKFTFLKNGTNMKILVNRNLAGLASYCLKFCSERISYVI